MSFVQAALNSSPYPAIDRFCAPHVAEDVWKKIHLRHGAALLSIHPILHYHRVRVIHGREERVLARYRKYKEVAYAELDSHYYAALTPNDPYYEGLYPSSQYGNVNQWGLPFVNAPSAFTALEAIPQGAYLAVIDTGIDLTHPDLQGNIARDTSGNVLGYNFVAGTNEPSDDNGHGTHVSGIAAAVTNNALGVAGISFNTVQIMPIKVLDANGAGATSMIADGILFAADHGADVINLSLGGSNYSQTLQNAISYAWNKGLAIVCAAGNNGSSAPDYPAGCNYALSVAALDQTGQPAFFSNSGEDLGIAAPGVAYLSTMPTYTVTLNSYGYENNYDALSGTSMAAPVVSGLCAALIAYAKSHNAALRGADTIAIVEQTAGSADRGWNPATGYGPLHAAKAVSPQPATGFPGSIRGQVIDSFGNAVSGAVVTAVNETTTTGADGMFRFANLTGGTYQVSASAGGNATTTPVSVSPGSDSFVSLTVTPAQTAVPCSWFLASARSLAKSMRKMEP
ncbi:S8 family serine peptidase [Ferroacidibacillus organovorans]|uniref:Peptidase S8/S53 domain-containing protein n=1 Tax=Ferroacidibacillus organovorans TaxID=1765683 RepID=A0A101XTR4_9BACL|nr:S8 family serine peptidase [Ferroacidibacillus organovorans]KUO97388.1 hypothetical protein ATW55_05855 [Ferroacidibacillus organovorans]